MFNSDGVFLRKIGSAADGAGDSKLKRPISVAILSSGHYVVAENGGSRMQIFDSLGNCVRLIGIGQVKKPWHLCVDDDDRILVCDYRNNRIQVFDQNGGNLCSFELKCLIRRE